MSYQNRVTLDGRIVVSSQRGTLMGNRGILHNDHQQLVRTSAQIAWIVCSLHAKDGSKRPLMEPGHYTPLFFLDEATALAAGHRPCAQCRRDAFNAFKQAWAKGQQLESVPLARQLDKVLSQERAPHARVTIADPTALPDGVMVQQVADSTAWLLYQAHARRWTFEGYQPAVPLAELTSPLEVLTPASTVAAIKAGYQPTLHTSAIAN